MVETNAVWSSFMSWFAQLTLNSELKRCCSNCFKAVSEEKLSCSVLVSLHSHPLTCLVFSTLVLSPATADLHVLN